VTAQNGNQAMIAETKAAISTHGVTTSLRLSIQIQIHKHEATFILKFTGEVMPANIDIPTEGIGHRMHSLQ
jgi:hypothetical protein